MSQIQKALGARVRELRTKLGISQEDLAERANLDRTYISSIENGNRNVSIQNIQILARALKTPLPEFFQSDFFGNSL